MKLVFENMKRMNEDYMIEVPTGDVIRLTDKQWDWAEKIFYYLDLGDDEDAMTEVEIDLAQGRASKYLNKLEGKAPKRTVDAFKSFLGHESKKRMTESYISSDDTVEFFKNFLHEYYSEYRDRHKDDIRFLSVLKSDLKELISKAVTDFWIE